MYCRYVHRYIWMHMQYNSRAVAGIKKMVRSYILQDTLYYIAIAAALITAISAKL